MVLAVLGVGMASAQATLGSGADGFRLVSGGEQAVVCYDGSEPVLMNTVSNLFANDVQRVTGRRLAVYDARQGNAKARRVVIVGTLENEWIKKLVKQNKLNTEGLAGAWERYRIETVKKPGNGFDEALVVAGSDRRGAAYGLLSVSRAIGVNPWYFWGDAPVEKRQTLSVNVKPFTSKQPSVKFRGVFINDEDWGLYQWAKNNYEKERGNFGPRTYAAVCELLLRLNANYLCPAMHNCSTAFFQVPENKVVADSFGIVMGTSHCEPLFLNTATEWFGDKYGPWNYETNKHGIDSVLEARVKETAPYENVYTLALRGLHDAAMNGSSDMASRCKTMGEAIAAQRDIIARNVKGCIEDIPQAFTPYKEVLDVYDKGLQLPDEVTIIWPDDNYGYMKRLSSPAEQKRSGRSGVYYHASYLGRPHNYLWMNTTSPTFMYEELRKAYDTTADRIWLLNAGDIKLCEFAVDYFLSLAYDIDSFDYRRSAGYRTEWTCAMLGDKYRNQFAYMFNTYYNLSFQRKPECMGFGAQWTNDAHQREINADTEFSFANYGEAERRLAEYTRISDMAERIMKQLPTQKRACFFENVYYQVKGCELVNRKMLYAQRNREYATEHRAATDYWAKLSMQCHDSLETITNQYSTMLGGKWNHIVSVKQQGSEAYYDRPELRTTRLSAGADMALAVEGEDVVRGRSSYHQLPAFSRFVPATYYIDVYNRGEKAFGWTAKASEPWIRLSRTKGSVTTEERLTVSVDWTKAPNGDRVAGHIEFVSDGGQKDEVLVSVFNPAQPSLADVRGQHVETNGYIAMNAADYQRKQESADVRISVVPNMGAAGDAVQLGNPVGKKGFASRTDAPFVEYDFYCFSQGPVDVYTYVLPTYTLCTAQGYAGHERTGVETHYGVTIDNTRIIEPSTSSVEYAQNWYESVLRNSRINKSTLYVPTPGHHKLRVICGDPGTVLQKVVLDFGGLKRSYMGPESTLVK